MNITTFTLIAGALLILWGRKLFWLLVAILGFMFGWYIVSTYLDVQTESTLLIVSIASGVLFALLGVFIQKLAIRVAGFAVAGFFLINVSESLGWHSEHFPWIPFVVGGIIGAILASFIFEWVLIVLSSLTGAYLVVRELHTSHSSGIIILVILAMIGIIFQSRKKGKPRAEKKRAEAEAEG
jgi:MFS family permease